MSNFRCKRNGQQCTCILCIRSERIHLYGTSTKRKHGPAPTQIYKKPGILQLCNLCLEPITCLSDHKCKRIDKGKEAAKQLLQTASPRGVKRLAYELIREELNDTGSAKMSTGGRPVKIKKINTSGPNNNNLPHQFKCSDIDSLRLKNNLSITQSLGIAQEIRRIVGKSAIEPNLKKHIQTSNKVFETVFAVTTYKDRPLVYCSNILEFLNIVQLKREDEPVLYRFGNDLGRGQTKLTLSILDTLEGENQRNKKTDMSKSGVKRCFVIATILDIGETYELIEKMIQLTNIESVFKKYGSSRVIFSSDLKLVNISLGIGSHASKFPCGFCYFQVTDESDEQFMERTFEDIRERNQKWINETNSNVRKLKDSKYMNCKDQPVFNQISGKVLDWVAPSSLHLMLGLTLRIYQALEKSYPRARDWLASINIAFQPQHGGQLAGNECRQIMSKVQSLKSFATIDGQLEIVEPYAEVLQALNAVVVCCLGNKLLPDYENAIQDFVQKFESLGIAGRMTKFHILKSHVVPFIKSRGNRGLGWFNEATLEASHYDFLRFWARHQIKAKDSSMAKAHLLKAVLEYNTLHI